MWCSWDCLDPCNTMPLVSRYCVPTGRCQAKLAATWSAMAPTGQTTSACSNALHTFHKIVPWFSGAVAVWPQLQWSCSRCIVNVQAAVIHSVLVRLCSCSRQWCPPHSKEQACSVSFLLQASTSHCQTLRVCALCHSSSDPVMHAHAVR